MRRPFQGARVCRLRGEVNDLVVGEVGGLDPAWLAVLGAQQRHAACLGVDQRLVGSIPASRCPALTQDAVRGRAGGAAEGPAVAKQVTQRRVDDLMRRPLGGQYRDDADVAASCGNIAGGVLELAALVLRISLTQLAGQMTYDLDLSGTWWCAWQTWKDDVPRIDVHILEVHQQGDPYSSTPTGQSRWQKAATGGAVKCGSGTTKHSSAGTAPPTPPSAPKERYI
jgi:hypothetical protein